MLSQISGKSNSKLFFQPFSYLDMDLEVISLKRINENRYGTSENKMGFEKLKELLHIL